MHNLMIHHHLGLGDHFICNGLVRYLFEARNPARLFLPTKNKYFHTVSRMFFDVPAIIPIPVNGDSDVAKLPQCALADEVLTIGFSQVKPEFDVSFYEMSGIPFSVRWSHFKAVRDPEREGSLEVKAGVHPKDRFILIHNISSVGRFHFTTRNDLRKVYVSQLSDCMLDWCSLAEKADEVHCIDSSFIHLAQTLNIKRGFFHRVRPTETHFVLRDGWETVEYASRKPFWRSFGLGARY